MMKLKAIHLTLIGFICVIILSSGFVPAHADFPAPADFHLTIPALNINLPVTTAHFIGNTWDFSHILTEAAYLEGRPMPGQGGNTVIGAHSELAQRAPGPFYDLNKIALGDQITIQYAGVEYQYVVTDIWSTVPSDASPLLSGSAETLTLMTCADYTDGIYAERLIVRATRIMAQSPFTV